MTQENPRDPGKIAGAFPSRAQGIMANLHNFNEKVKKLNQQYPPTDKTFVDNNPHSEAAMRAEASSGKTSRRSPYRPSAAQRQQLTGVKENCEAQGWVRAVAMGHLCFPPEQYPQECGPGSLWNCRCDAVWRAEGVMWEEYPTDPSRTAQPLGPERWFYQEGGQLDEEDYRAQEGLYDWRPLGPYYVKLYRAMIDNQLAAEHKHLMKKPVTWEELG
jgi:hypothetical protein